jgi:uncharacterized protein YdeI (YjbR/CyaY-like superfamily)
VTVVEARTAGEWREWLSRHAGDAAEVWLVIPHARSGRPGISHRQAIEEALCFGWIDGLARRHDEGSWRQRFTPRGPRSAWSTINREIVDRLTAEGRMTPAGQAVVDIAKANGMWTLLADAQAGVVPDDLRGALDADPAAAAGWDALRPSARRMCLEALARAKRPDTRQRRVCDAVGVARATVGA